MAIVAHRLLDHFPVPFDHSLVRHLSTLRKPLSVGIWTDVFTIILVTICLYSSYDLADQEETAL